MLHRRILRFHRVILSASFALWLAGCSNSNTNPPSASEEPPCGIERWSVKILTDPAAANINWTPVPTTVAEQNSYSETKVSVDTPRLSFEEQAVSLPCTIAAFKLEDDHDIHLVLIDNAGDSMVGEIPGTSCAEVAASPFAPEFDSAAKWVTDHLGTPSPNEFKHANASVTITGVPFQDFVHNVTGHAHNFREIHPVIRIQ